MTLKRRRETALMRGSIQHEIDIRKKPLEDAIKNYPDRVYIANTTRLICSMTRADEELVGRCVQYKFRGLARMAYGISYDEGIEYEEGSGYVVLRRRHSTLEKVWQRNRPLWFEEE